MGLLASALLTELRKPTVAANFLFEMSDPDGGEDILLSSDGVSSLSLGYYAPWVSKWGTLSRSLSNWRGGLEPSKLTIEIDDTGGQFSRVYGRDLRGQTAVCRLVSPNVAAASYFVWFNGLVDSVRKSGSRLTIECRQDDDPLEVELTKAPIRNNTFSALPAKGDATGKSVPYLIGDHDSTALSALGMLKCLYVDSSGFRYVVALGWWVTVLRVFVDGVLKVDPADYSVTQALTGDSRKVTLIDFTAALAEGAEVLVDVQDLESAAGPAACLKVLLEDLVWNDYHLGSFGSTGVPLSASHFTAADRHISTASGLGRAYYIGPDRLKGFDVLKGFGDSYAVDWFWTFDGNLAPLVWDHRQQEAQIYLGPGIDTTRVITEADYLSDPEFYVDSESTVNRLLGKSGLRNADGTWLNQRTVMIETAEQERAATVDMPWLPSTQESIAAVAYLTPNGTASAGSWSLGAGASLEAAVADDPAAGIGDGNTSYDFVDGASVPTTTAIRFDMSDMTASVVSITSVETLITCAGAGTVSGSDDEQVIPGPFLSGVNYDGTPIVGIGNGYRRVIARVDAADPSTTLPWTVSGLNGMQYHLSWTAGAVSSANKQNRQTQCAFKINYVPAANVSPGNLAVLSRRVNRYGVAPHLMRVKLPLEFLDLEIGDSAPVQDSREGWGDEPWEHRLFRVRGMSLDPSDPSVTLTLEDVQAQLTSFRLFGKALVGVDGSSAAGDGMLLLTPGSTVTVTRASPKNVDSPAGIGVQSAGPVVQILNNCWPSERYGTLMERARTNLIVRSSFATLSGGAGSVPTGWTATSGTVASDATIGEQLWTDATVTANVLLLTQNAADSRATATTTASILANTKVCFSIDRKSSSATTGDGGSWRLVRGVDGWFWNNTTPAWQAGAVDNVLTPTTSWARFESAPFSIGAGATTLTASVVLLSTATAACTLRVGHVQAEEGEWASSRIVTGAAVVTRAADEITFANDCSDGATTYYVHPNTRGTLKLRFKANWNSAEVTAGTEFYFWRVPYSSGNRWELHFLAGTGFVFTGRSGAVDVSATVNVAVVDGTEYTVYARWTSSLGEWGKTSILTLVVDDGTTITSADSATYTTPVFSSGRDVAFAANLDGYVIEAVLSPFCLSDEEMGI